MSVDFACNNFQSTKKPLRNIELFLVLDNACGVVDNLAWRKNTFLRHAMRKNSVAANSIILKWGKLHLVASGQLAICAIIALAVLSVLYFGHYVLGI